MNLRQEQGGQNFSSMPTAGGVLDCGASVCVVAVRVGGAVPVGGVGVLAACRTLHPLICRVGGLDMPLVWCHHLGRCGADAALLHHVNSQIEGGGAFGFPFQSEHCFDFSHKPIQKTTVSKPITSLCPELGYLRVAKRELRVGEISL
jgi:hypothetical protein